MYKLNHLLYPQTFEFNINENYSLEALKPNFEFDKLVRNFKMKYGFDSLNSFSFSIDGFVAMMMQLQGKIAVSLGEAHFIVQAAKKCEAYGADITFIGLTKEGKVKTNELSKKSFDFIFVSSYVMDTFVKTDLKAIKKTCKAKIIANVSASQEDMNCVDVALFDAYKLTGYYTHSIALHNELLEEQPLSNQDYIAFQMIYSVMTQEKVVCEFKQKFIDTLKDELEGNMFFFVPNENTLENSLHFGLKDIKAREIIRTLALNSIFITNGEGCSLGLSQPSKIIQAMGYSELESRQAISLSFNCTLSNEDITKISKAISKSYRQIRRLNG